MGGGVVGQEHKDAAGLALVQMLQQAAAAAAPEHESDEVRDMAMGGHGCSAAVDWG